MLVADHPLNIDEHREHSEADAQCDEYIVCESAGDKSDKCSNRNGYCVRKLSPDMLDMSASGAS